MMPRLRTVLVKAALATVFSVVGSLALTLSIVPALGGVVEGNAVLMTILCPLLIAGPASAWQFWQQERLRAAHNEIGRLHAALADAHSTLTERARRDEMTGLLNRGGFFAEVEQALAGGGEGTLLLIDADHFKAINDRFGHPAGDAALRTIAGVIADELSPLDLGGRVGGEEFAVYRPGPDTAAALAMAERIRRAVAASRLTDEIGVPIALSVSIGGAPRQVGATMAALFAASDRQLYRAKRLGRDKVIVERDLPVAA